MTGRVSDAQRHDHGEAGRETPNGLAAAAILSAGIGSCSLGILAVAADASKVLASALTFYQPTGPLSGVTLVPLLLWLMSWWLLSRLWRNSMVTMSKINVATFILMAIALLLTFPPIGDGLIGK